MAAILIEATCDEYTGVTAATPPRAQRSHRSTEACLENLGFFYTQQQLPIATKLLRMQRLFMSDHAVSLSASAVRPVTS